MRPASPLFRAWADAARAVPIADVTQARGLRLRGSVERVGPCPHCGGEDRFGINTRKNIFGCRGCGNAGGPIDLVMLLDGLTFLQACEHLTGQAPPDGRESGLSQDKLAEMEAERAAKRREADAASASYAEVERRQLYRWWERAKFCAGTPAEAYLRLRGVDLPGGALLRFEPEWALYDDRLDAAGRRQPTVVHRGPCLFAAIVGPDGHFSGLHMTWIDLARPDGKALVPDPRTGEFVAAKKMRGAAKGGRIELVRVRDPWCLVIGEGIETTLSFRQGLVREGRDLKGIAFWGALSLQNLGGPHLEKVTHPTLRRIDKLDRSYPLTLPGPVPDLTGKAIPVPDTVAHVITLGDGDSDLFTAVQAHARAARRWAKPGRRVAPVFAPVDTDFNSYLRD